MILCFAILAVPYAFIAWVIWMDLAYMLKQRRARAQRRAASNVPVQGSGS